MSGHSVADHAKMRDALKEKYTNELYQDERRRRREQRRYEAASYEAGQRIVRRVGLGAVIAASVTVAASIMYAVTH
ncbi:hypothetical protein [Paraburkholderia heleia]|uniref:hypothetical protein n=1 Tax=Paraburkholderia heleia TaxID=634127 RepID=UPI0005A5DE96|nr:hypothetical protein [Paraburkholderia heleia]